MAVGFGLTYHSVGANVAHIWHPAAYISVLEGIQRSQSSVYSVQFPDKTNYVS